MILKNLQFDLYNYHNLFKQDIHLSYKGPFNEVILTVLGRYIQDIIGRNPNISRKLFRVFIELAQNIAYYSAEISVISGKHLVGVGSVLIGEIDNIYTCATGNIVDNKHINILIDICNKINSLDRESLRKYKRERRKQPRGEHDTSNIGLIDVALTADNPLNIVVTPVSENTSYFSLAVKIEKT